MANTAKISVALTAELNELVQSAVASGEYATGSEVIREALREWKLRRTRQHSADAALRQLWAEGIASGPGRLGSMAAIKAEARRRLRTAPAEPE